MGEYLGKHIIAAGGEMAVDNFGNRLQALNDFIELCGVIEDKTYVGACLIANRRRIDDGLKPTYNAIGC